MEIADKLKMYCLWKRIPDTQVLEIVDKTINGIAKNLKQSSIVSYFNKPVYPSQ